MSSKVALPGVAPPEALPMVWGRMVTPREKLAVSLARLGKLEEGGVRVIRSADLTRVHRERLPMDGCLRKVMTGWLISTGPGAEASDTTPCCSRDRPVCTEAYIRRDRPSRGAYRRLPSGYVGTLPEACPRGLPTGSGYAARPGRLPAVRRGYLPKRCLLLAVNRWLSRHP